MTSIGEMSAARTTMPGGEAVVEVVAGVDLRRLLTTSLTPRLRDLFLAAGNRVVLILERYIAS